MQAKFRAALQADIPALLPIMQEFCIFERIRFDAEQRIQLLTALLSDPATGCLFPIAGDDTLAGYYVLGFGFSIEFGGRDALLDELYVRPEHRKGGMGTAA